MPQTTETGTTPVGNGGGQRAGATDALLSETVARGPVSLFRAAWGVSPLLSSLGSRAPLHSALRAGAVLGALLSAVGTSAGLSAARSAPAASPLSEMAAASPVRAATGNVGASRAATAPLLTSSAGRGGLQAPRTGAALNSLLGGAGATLMTPASTPQVPTPQMGTGSPHDPFWSNTDFLRSLAAAKGLPMIAPPKLLAILDRIAASFRTSDAQASTATLSTVGQLVFGGDGISSTVYGTGDQAFILKCANTADTIAAKAAPDAQNAAVYNPWFQMLAGYLASEGRALGSPTPPAVAGPPPFSSLDTYASYANGPPSPARPGAGGPYSFLVSPNVAYLQWLYAGKAPTLLMSPANVFAPQTTFGAATVLGGAALAYAPLSSIPTVNAGAIGQQGYAPAPGVTAQVTADIAGPLTVTLTGDGWDAAGVAFTGRQWTARLDDVPAGASVAFTGPDGVTPAAPGQPPAPVFAGAGGAFDLPDAPDGPDSGTAPSQAATPVTGDRIAAVTSVAAVGTATAGAFSLMSVIERSVS